MTKSNQTRRLDFGQVVDRLFWAMITGAVIYGSSQLKAVSGSVEELNVKMAVVIYQISNAEKRADAQDKAIEDIRKKFRK